MIRRFLARQEGQGMAEYSLILALVAVVAIIALTAMGPEVKAIFERIVASLSSV